MSITDPRLVFTLTSLSEPALAGHKERVEGRVSELPLLLPIVDALAEMQVGELRPLTFTYPVDWPLEHLAGTEGSVLIELLERA